MTDTAFAPGDRVQFTLFGLPANGTIVHDHGDDPEDAYGYYQYCIEADDYADRRRNPNNCAGLFKRRPDQPITRLAPARTVITTEGAW